MIRPREALRVACSACFKPYVYFSTRGRHNRPFLGVVQPDGRVKYYCPAHEDQAVPR